MARKVPCLEFSVESFGQIVITVNGSTAVLSLIENLEKKVAWLFECLWS